MISWIRFKLGSQILMLKRHDLNHDHKCLVSKYYIQIVNTFPEFLKIWLESRPQILKIFKEFERRLQIRWDLMNLLRLYYKWDKSRLVNHWTRITTTNPDFVKLGFKSWFKSNLTLLDREFRFSSLIWLDSHGFVFKSCILTIITSSILIVELISVELFTFPAYSTTKGEEWRIAISYLRNCQIFLFFISPRNSYFD